MNKKQQIIFRSAEIKYPFVSFSSLILNQNIWVITTARFNYVWIEDD